MDSRTRFIHEANIANFAARLTSAADLPLHDMQRRLLLEELESFGSDGEKLGPLERLIADNRAHIEQQQAFLAKTDVDDTLATSARTLLASYVTTRALLLDYRGTLRGRQIR